MAITARKQLDQTSLVMKQASLGRMLMQAKTLQERGQLKKAPVAAGLSRPAARPLRVKSTVA
jgi:hypothetical protein